MIESMGGTFTRAADLYAGTGAMGIEALSRDVPWCDFVEQDRRLCQVIKRNLETTGLADRARVYCSPVAKAMGFLTEPCDLFFVDPPYRKGYVRATLDLLAASRLALPGAVIVAEHEEELEPQAAHGPLRLVKTRRHGDTGVSIYRKEMPA